MDTHTKEILEDSTTCVRDWIRQRLDGLDSSPVPVPDGPGDPLESRACLAQLNVGKSAPICSNIRESDFMQNLRLENGKQIWEALWENRHPDAECFITPVS